MPCTLQTCKKEVAICFQRFPQMGSQSVLLWNHQTSGPATYHAKKSAFLMFGRPRLHITLTVCSLAVTNQSGHKLQPQSLYFCLLRQTFLGSKAPKFQVHPLAISPSQCNAKCKFGICFLGLQSHRKSWWWQTPSKRLSELRKASLSSHQDAWQSLCFFESSRDCVQCTSLLNFKRVHRLHLRSIK